MNDDYHPVIHKIVDLLKTEGCWFESFAHQPVRTSEEAALVRTGYSLSQGAKALIVRIKRPNQEKEFVMLVMSGDQKFDKFKVKQALQSKDLRFATEEEVLIITDGVQLGGVPPFGNLFGLQVIADQALFNHEVIIFNAGDKKFSVAMKSADYRRLVQPQVAEIC